MVLPTEKTADHDIEVLNKARATWGSTESYRSALDNAARYVIVGGKSLACNFGINVGQTNGNLDANAVHETIIELTEIARYVPKSGVHYLICYCPDSREYQIKSVAGESLLRVTRVAQHLVQNGKSTIDLAFLLETVRLFGCIDHAISSIKEDCTYLVDRGIHPDSSTTAERFAFQQSDDDLYTPALIPLEDRVAQVLLVN